MENTRHNEINNNNNNNNNINNNNNYGVYDEDEINENFINCGEEKLRHNVNHQNLLAKTKLTRSMYNKALFNEEKAKNYFALRRCNTSMQINEQKMTNHIVTTKQIETENSDQINQLKNQKYRTPSAVSNNNQNDIVKFDRDHSFRVSANKLNSNIEIFKPYAGVYFLNFINNFINNLVSL